MGKWSPILSVPSLVEAAQRPTQPIPSQVAQSLPEDMPPRPLDFSPKNNAKIKPKIIIAMVIIAVTSAIAFFIQAPRDTANLKSVEQPSLTKETSKVDEDLLNGKVGGFISKLKEHTPGAELDNTMPAPDPNNVIVSLEPAANNSGCLILLQLNEIQLSNLASLLASAVLVQPINNRKVFLRINEEVPYRSAMNVLDQIQFASEQAKRDSLAQSDKFLGNDGGNIKIFLAVAKFNFSQTQNALSYPLKTDLSTAPPERENSQQGMVMAQAVNAEAQADAPISDPLAVDGTGKVLELDSSQVKIKYQPPQPPYPPLAKIANIQGTVVVEIIIGPDGVPTDAVAKEGPPQLRDYAANWGKTWRFEPAMLKGQPQYARFKIRMAFRLR